MTNYAELERIIIDAKKKYRTVFSTNINGELFIWRLLTSLEHEIIIKTSAGDEMIKEELVCQTTVIYPEVNFGLYKAGVPTHLAPQILEESGFKDKYKAQRFLSISRVDVLTKFHEQAFILIASAFPQYSFEEMEDWDIEKLTKMIARAEWKVNMIDGKDFLFEQEEEEEQEDEMSEEQKLKELEDKIIEKGGDPIATLYHSVYKQDTPYVDTPNILGNNLYREDVVDAVRQRVQQRISDSRRLL